LKTIAKATLKVLIRIKAGVVPDQNLGKLLSQLVLPFFTKLSKKLQKYLRTLCQACEALIFHNFCEPKP
jgi:hypothetical protein